MGGPFALVAGPGDRGQQNDAHQRGAAGGDLVGRPEVRDGRPQGGRRPGPQAAARRLKLNGWRCIASGSDPWDLWSGKALASLPDHRTSH